MRAGTRFALTTMSILLLSTCNGADTNAPELDGRWGAAQLVETNSSSWATNPRVAIEAGSGAIVVWVQSEGEGQVRVNRLTGGDWGTADVVPGSAGGLMPSVASDRNGHVIAVWQCTEGSTSVIRASRFVAGQGWGSPQLVFSDNTVGAFKPEIAADRRGNAVVVWRQDNVIGANGYDAVNGWGTASVISDNAELAGGAQVAFDNNGNAIAVWRQGEGSGQSIHWRRYSIDGGWDVPGPVLDNTVVDSPSVAMNDRGDAVAAWQKSWTDNVTLSVNVRARIYDPATGWGPATMISDDTGYAIAPQVAIDPDGNAVAIWTQFNGTNYVAWANRYARGRGWGAAVIIGPQGAGDGDAFPSQVAVDPEGNAIAVWTQTFPGPSHVWVNRYRRNIGWGTPSMLDNTDSYRGSDARVAIDGAGNAIVVWQQLPSSGAIYDIWARRFQKRSP